MDYFKITTDETLRETVQHGSERYPLHIILRISGNLIFTVSTGTGIMNWNFFMLQKAQQSALSVQAK